MDNNFYSNHHRFIYQNPSCTNRESVNRSTYRHADHGYERCGNLKLATIYVKAQVYNGINSPADAFQQGTAFKELYRPFVGKGGQR